MKKLLVMMATILVAGTAMASISFLGRVDYLNMPDFKNQGDNNQDGMSRFLGTGAYIDFTGKAGDIDVVGRLDLLGNSMGVQYTDPGTAALTPANFVDWLYLSKGFGDITVTFGRLVSNAGGMEKAEINKLADYNATLANGGAPGTYTVGGDVMNAGNLNGVAATWKSGMNAVELAATEGQNALVAGAAHKRHDLSVTYMGEFMDKNLTVNAGYLAGAFDTTGTPVDSINTTDMHAGVHFKAGMFGITLESFMNSAKDEATGAKKDALTSDYVKLDYATGTCTPFLKYEMSDLKLQEDDNTIISGTNASFKRSAYTLGADWVMKAGDSASYHLAYTGVNDKAGASALKSVNWALVTVGVTLSTDLLK